MLAWTLSRDALCSRTSLFPIFPLPSLIYIAPNASLSFLVLIVLLALIADLGYVFFSLSKTIYKEMGL
jgi:nitric oxide reductase large subunit